MLRRMVVLPLPDAPKIGEHVAGVAGEFEIQRNRRRLAEAGPTSRRSATARTYRCDNKVVVTSASSRRSPAALRP